MTRPATLPRIANTLRLYELLCWYAEDVTGALVGLTGAELRFAWKIRHGSALPRHALTTLASCGLVRQLRQRRTCDVTRHYRRPWVPVAMLDGRSS